MAILDDLMPALYVGLGTVAREMVGFIPVVNKNTGAERAAKVQIKRPNKARRCG